MVRDIITNKWILGGILMLIIIAGGCYFWYQYTLAPYREQAAKTEEVARKWKLTQKPRNTNEAQQAADQTPTDGTVPTGEKSNSPKQLQVGDMVDGRIYLGKRPPSPELLAEFGVLPPTQDEIISPYGFGPYPELPEGFGPITWPRKSANSELRIRVKIKLLKQGVPVEGSIMENGLVYPILKGVRYVIWGETSYGRQYLRRSLGHPDDGDYMRKIKNEKKARRESITAADFPGIKLVPFEEAGIDPYTFLDLPK